MATFILENNGELEAPVLPDVDVESIMADDDVKAAFEDSALEAACRACAENTNNWNMILKESAIYECNYYAQTGKEYIYEGSKLDDFFDNAKKFFENIWKKIQEIFKSVIAKFDSWFKDDKQFVSKYEKQINAASHNLASSDKEIEVYTFPTLAAHVDKWTEGLDLGKSVTINDIKAIYGNPNDTKDIDEDKADSSLDELRGKFVAAVSTSSSSSVSAQDFTKELKEALEGDKETTKLSGLIEPALTHLKNSNSVKKSLTDGLKNSKKAIDESIKNLEKEKKDCYKTMSDKSPEGKAAGETHTWAVKAINYDKAVKNIMTQYEGACLDALKRYSRQCKSVCVKALTYRDKDQKDSHSALYKESAMYMHFE